MLLEQQVSDSPSCWIHLTVERVYERRFSPEICCRLSFLSGAASWQSMKPSSSGSVVVYPAASKLSVTRNDIPVSIPYTTICLVLRKQGI